MGSEMCKRQDLEFRILYLFTTHDLCFDEDSTTLINHKLFRAALNLKKGKVYSSSIVIFSQSPEPLELQWGKGKKQNIIALFWKLSVR